MLKLKNTISILFILSALNISAQQYGSCDEALEICSKGNLQLKYIVQPENKEALLIPNSSNTCFIVEHETTWIKWEIAKTGYLSFSLTPSESLVDDIDFALFKLSDKKGCKTKKSIRCMNSGFELAGDKIEINSLKCSGTTGLSVADRGANNEGAGCNYGDNNFLPAINCKAGEKYALAVVSYGNKMHDFYLSLCGSAELLCDSVFCEETTKKAAQLPKKQEVIFPSRSSSDSLDIYFWEYKSQPVAAKFKNMLGQIVLVETFEIEDGKSKYGIPIGKLPRGEYIVKIRMRKTDIVSRFQRE